MKRILLILILSACYQVIILRAQQIAFPGAEGFGKYATGGRGGAVIKVTNLNDNGTGSLRAAIGVNVVRTIVFTVSGTIYLQSPLQITRGNLTIAGQTAPGDGITLANYNFQIKADNVIIRYIRSRMGDNVNQEDDAFTCRNRQDIIVDHCTFSWGIDEVASCYENTNFTMQWCIISESLYNSVHDKGYHGYGGIWGGSGASFLYNLLAHHSSRTPRFNGARYHTYPWEEIVDFRNNVIYNWGFNSSYGGEPSDIDTIRPYTNMVGNYYKPGPGTNNSAVKYRILEPYDQGTKGFGRWYIDSNYVFNSVNATTDNWLYGVQNVSEAQKTEMKSSVPFDFEISATYAAEEIFPQVLENAGVTIPYRDTIDKRIAWETENGTALYGGSTWGTGKGIIDSQNDVGGFPELFSAPALSDRDNDGMPDMWEENNDLNADNPDDRNGDSLGLGYTNLEYYLNSITAFREFIRPPSDLNALGKHDSIILSWKNNTTLAGQIIIERKDIGAFYSIDTLPPTFESYTDTGLISGAQYSYRFKSFNSGDTSVYSETVTASTISAENELFTDQKVSVYPNPAFENLMIHIPGNISGNLFITIHDITGKTRISQIITANEITANEIRIDISALNSGIYNCHISSPEIYESRKFVVW